MPSLYKIEYNKSLYLVQDADQSGCLYLKKSSYLCIGEISLPFTCSRLVYFYCERGVAKAY